MPQGVLVRASAELTVTQALEIADMTLETSCRAIQWAINVPEVLLASAGAQDTVNCTCFKGPCWHSVEVARLLCSQSAVMGIWLFTASMLMGSTRRLIACLYCRQHAVAWAGPAAVQAAAVTTYGAAGDMPW